MLDMGLDQGLVIGVQGINLVGPSDNPVRLPKIDNGNPVKAGFVEQAQGLFNRCPHRQPGKFRFPIRIETIIFRLAQGRHELLNPQGVQNIGDIAKSISTGASTQPTIIVNQGARIKVFVNKDLIFPDSVVKRISFGN